MKARQRRYVRLKKRRFSGAAYRPTSRPIRHAPVGLSLWATYAARGEGFLVLSHLQYALACFVGLWNGACRRFGGVSFLNL